MLYFEVIHSETKRLGHEVSCFIGNQSLAELICLTHQLYGTLDAESGGISHLEPEFSHDCFAQRLGLPR